MPIKQTDISEFYQQLALLVKSNLPLPKSLAQLGATFHKRRFKMVLQQISADIASGKPLHEAMAKHPEFFPPFQLQLIRTGEESGTLPEVLLEVARFSKNNQSLLAKTKDILCYPLFTLFFGSLVLVALLRFVVPEFALVYQELTAYASDNVVLYGTVIKPDLQTRTLFSLSEAVNAAGNTPFVALLILACLIMFLFIGFARVDHVLYRFMGWVPGVRQVIYCADWARVSGLLHVYLKRKVPMVESLTQTAGLTEKRSLKMQLEAWRDRISRGESLERLMHGTDNGADPLFALCVRHSPEDQLPDELRQLAEVFLDRADKARERAMFLWHSLLVLAMTAFVGWVIFSMFNLLIFMMKGVL